MRQRGKRHPRRSVSDGMHSQRVRQPASRPDNFVHPLPGMNRKARGLGCIAVRLLQEGGPSADCPVGEQLDCTEPQPFIAAAGGKPELFYLLQIGVIEQLMGAEAYPLLPQLAVNPQHRVHAAQQPQILGMHGGQSHREGVPDAPADRLLEGGIVRGRLHFIERLNGILIDPAIQLPCGVTPVGSRRKVRGHVRDARPPERLAVAEEGVEAGPGQEHRMPLGHSVELGNMRS
ncbi:hypothetical protein D3C73_974140 [compost metagenome]